jgi:O-antigen/teichoic acid export membrane protein
VLLLIRGFIYRLIFTAINFLVNLLIAKLAGAGQFGSLSLMIVNAAAFHILTGLGTDAAIVWHGLSEKKFNHNKVFSFTIGSAALQLLIFIAVAGLFFYITGRSLLSGNKNTDIFFAELIYFTGLVLTDKFISLYYSQQLAALCNKLLAVASLVLFAVLVAGWLGSLIPVNNNPVWVFSLFVFIPALLLLIYYLVKYHPVPARFSGEELKSFLSFSFIVFITNLVQFVAYRADYWFIDVLHDKKDVGIYAQAARFAQLLWILPGIAAGLVIPALKNEKQKLSNEDFAGLCRLVFFSHLVFAAVAVAAAYFIYSFILPQEYFSGFSALLIMLPGYIFFTITTMIAAWFSANRFLKINLSGSFICCAVILLLDWLLIPALSYNGAAIANLVSYSITTFFFIFMASKSAYAGLKDFFVIRFADFKLFSKKVLLQQNAAEA